MIRVIAAALLGISSACAEARGWRGGSGDLLPFWETAALSLSALLFVVLWKSHAGKILAIFGIAVIGRELLRS